MDREVVWNTIVSELHGALPLLNGMTVSASDRFVNIGANSLDRIDLAISVSEKMGITDDDEYISSLAFTDTLGEFLKIICERIAASDIKRETPVG